MTKSTAAGSDLERVNRILVPVDFSEPSFEAFRYACGFARAHGAHIDLLHVIEPPTFPSFYQIGAVALYGQVPDLEARARGALANLIAEAEHPRPAIRQAKHCRKLTASAFWRPTRCAAARWRP